MKLIPSKNKDERSNIYYCKRFFFFLYKLLFFSKPENTFCIIFLRTFLSIQNALFPFNYIFIFWSIQNAFLSFQLFFHFLLSWWKNIPTCVLSKKKRPTCVWPRCGKKPIHIKTLCLIFWILRKPTYMTIITFYGHSKRLW